MTYIKKYPIECVCLLSKVPSNDDVKVSLQSEEIRSIIITNNFHSYRVERRLENNNILHENNFMRTIVGCTHKDKRLINSNVTEAFKEMCFIFSSSLAFYHN